jgi:hypothetical protein
MIENFIKEKVEEILSKKEIPELSKDFVATDNIGEVIEKLIILNIRCWMLEDEVAKTTDLSTVGELKKKIDICFKQKRPKYVEAINRMLDAAIINNKSLVEDSVKFYKEVK